MPTPIRYGIIGAGAIAQRRHMPEAHANPRSTVVAIADPVVERVNALAEQYGANAYTDHKAMLKAEKGNLDAVVVCGPNKLHAPQSIDAFKAGLHVLCEKPMATSRADAKKMIAAADKAGKYLMIGLNQRLMSAHVKAKEVLQGKKLGKVLTFRTEFQHPGPDGWSVDGAKSWFFDPEAAFMGATGDLGVHKADLMRWLLGEEFTTASGIITTLDKKDSKGKPIGLDDNAIITLETGSGTTGVMIVSWTNYGGEANSTTLFCEKGVLKMGAHPEFGVVVEYRDGTSEYHKVGAMASNKAQVASGIIDSFTDCIRRKKKPSIDGDEGYKCLDVILTAMDAAKQNKTLPIKY